MSSEKRISNCFHITSQKQTFNRMIFFPPYPGPGPVSFKSITSKQIPLSVNYRDIIARIRNQWEIHRELYIPQLSGLVSYRRLKTRIKILPTFHLLLTNNIKLVTIAILTAFTHTQSTQEVYKSFTLSVKNLLQIFWMVTIIATMKNPIWNNFWYIFNLWKLSEFL